MDTILNSSEQTFQVPLGGTLTMRQSSPGAAAVCALQFADAPVAFTTAVLSNATPIVVGPYNANLRVMVAAVGQVAVEVTIGVGGVGGPSIGLVNALTSTDSTQALAASQGPPIVAAIATAQNQAVIATNSASDAVAAVVTANTNAAAAVAAAALATTTANAAQATANLAAPKANPAMTGNVGVPTRNPGDNTANAASTAFVLAAVAAVPPGNAVLTTPRTAIPFDTSRYMVTQVVSGPLAFTVDATGSNIGGEMLASYQADGVNLPTFTGMSQVGAVAYGNVAGQTYDILFFRTPSGYYYGITLGPAVDITLPTLLSASVSNANPTHIDLVWSEAMNATISAFGAFTVSAGHTLNAHTRVDATHSFLTTTAAFVNGEAARTLAYAQPGSNKMQDLAGNLLANIASAAIANNVLDTRAPLLVSHTVQNAAPSVIEVLFDEALAGYPTVGNLPAFSAFAVSAGHTLTAIAWGTSALMVKLTTSTPFVFGEAARTGAYTQPGSNNLADASANAVANYTGQAITNNVAASIVYSDTFTRANAGSLGVASGGFTWGVGGGATGIVSNKAKGAGDNYVDLGGSTGEFAFQGTFNIPVLTGFPNFVFDTNASTPNFYGVGITNTGELQFFSVISSSFAIIRTTAAGLVTAGVDATIGIFKTQNFSNPTRFDYTVTLNGTPVIFLSNQSLTSFGTYIHFNLANANDTFDNFVSNAAAAGGSLTITSLGTPSAFNVTTASGVTDWVSFDTSPGGGGITRRKNGGTAFGQTASADNYSAEANPATTGTVLGFTWNTGDELHNTGAGGTEALGAQLQRGSGSGKPTLSVAVAIGIGAKKVKAYFAAFRNTAGFPTVDGKVTISATLSDRSAAPVSAAIAPVTDGVATGYSYEFDVTAASAGQVLIVEFGLPAGTDGQTFADLLTFGT